MATFLVPAGYSASFEGVEYPFYVVGGDTVWAELSLIDKLAFQIPYSISSYHAGDTGGVDPQFLIDCMEWLHDEPEGNVQ